LLLLVGVVLLTWPLRPSVRGQQPLAWQHHRSTHFEFFYPASVHSRVVSLASETERVYARLSLTFRHQFAEPLPVIVMRDELEVLRGADHVRALSPAGGGRERARLVVSLEGFDRRADAMLAHELTHRFLIDLFPEALLRAPWVAESLADHHSGEWGPTDVARIREALARGTAPEVSSLTATDRHWGHAVFDMIAAEYGARGVRRYLSALGAKPSPGLDAASAALGLSKAEFDVELRKYLDARFRAQ
jgi:hypothetical protein